MTAHLVTAALFMAAVLSAGYGLRAAVRLRARRLIGKVTEDAGGAPTILYFTSPGCTVCRLVQEPALDEVRETVGPLYHLQTVDVSIDPTTARRYNVLTSPTTVLLDSTGTVRAVNTGVADTRLLVEQITQAM